MSEGPNPPMSKEEFLKRYPKGDYASFVSKHDAKRNVDEHFHDVTKTTPGARTGNTGKATNQAWFDNLTSAQKAEMGNPKDLKAAKTWVGDYWSKKNTKKTVTQEKLGEIAGTTIKPEAVVNPTTADAVTDNIDWSAPVKSQGDPTKGFGEKLKEKMGGSGAGGFAQIAQGLAKTAGSLIGGGKRRREQRAANKELKQRKQAYEDFEMKNVHADSTNPYEDLKVNTQEAEFMAQQSQQGLANTLGSLSATAGGSGIAALAQTMAGQQSMNIQRAGASIGMQESRNEAQRAAGEERRQVRVAQGAADVQQFELGRTETLFDMASTRKKEADAARAKATQDLVGGIADVAVGVGRVAVGGA